METDLALLLLKVWDHGTKGVDLVAGGGRLVPLTVAPRWLSSLSLEEIG
jgi:hypothetical protein